MSFGRRKMDEVVVDPGEGKLGLAGILALSRGWAGWRFRHRVGRCYQDSLAEESDPFLVLPRSKWS